MSDKFLQTGAVKIGDIAEGAVGQSNCDFQNYVHSGLIVEQKGTPNLSVSATAGFFKIAGQIYYRAALAVDTVYVVVASSGKECVAILQIDGAGTISVKKGAEVTAGDLNAQYPSPDAGNIILAKLFTPAVPLLNSTTTVLTANIDNTARTIL